MISQDDSMANRKAETGKKTIMTKETSANPSISSTDSGRYYIMYDPTTVDLMNKIDDDHFAVTDIVDYLTGRKLETCHEGNYTEFLTFNINRLRKGMLEQMAIEPYKAYYIANQICNADQDATVILADDTRKTIGQVILEKGKKPAAVFMSLISSTFPTACAAILVLNRVNIPVVIGGIHVSTSPDDVDVYLKRYLPHPEMVSQVIGAGDLSTMKEIISDIAHGSLKKEYHGKIPIEDRVWGCNRVIELPKIRPYFIDKFPIIGPILSRIIETNVSTPFLGCPFSCSFCSISSFPEEKRKFTSRSPEDFTRELLDKQKNGVTLKNRFYFISPDNLLFGGKKLHDVLDAMIDSPLKINYAAQISIEVADSGKLLEKLRRSGASHFFIGLESLDIRNLESVGKNIVAKIKKEKTTVEEYYSSRIKIIQDHGISVHGAFMFGMPYDYFHSLEDHSAIRIVEFCKKNKIGMQPTCLSNLPGSLDFINGLKNNELIYGNPGSMNYLCSLTIADLTESNRRIPDSLHNSPLVAFYMLYDTMEKIGSYGSALRIAFGMARKAWNVHSSKGAQSLIDRVIDTFAGVGFQLGASAYYELYKELAYSTKWLPGSFERLYQFEKNPRIKEMFRDYVKKFTWDKH